MFAPRLDSVGRGTALLLLLSAGGCRRHEAAAPSPLEAAPSPFKDAFERVELGADWHPTGGDYRVVNGELDAKRLGHHPIWLNRPMPQNVAIELDARPTSPDGDIRIVLFGDGHSTNPDRETCESSGYELVFGGWKNTLSVLCRGDQGGRGHERARADWPVVPGRTYHYYITRKDGVIDWYIDGIQMTAWQDKTPLQGPGHDRFAFDGGSAQVVFDNLEIGPLPTGP